MKRAVYFILAILLINFTSCRKPSNSHTTHPNAVSNSTYNYAYLAFGKFKNINRDGAGNNIVEDAFNVMVGFGNSNNVDLHGGIHFGDSVGSVTLGSFVLNNADLTIIHGSLYYFHVESNIADSILNKFEPEIWKVVSKNGVTDMSFDAGHSLNYMDTMPYQITRSMGFTMAINPTTVQNADSVQIVISTGAANSVGITVPSSIGSVTFSPSQLSILESVNDWTARIEIRPFKRYNYVVNGRGYSIDHELHVEYNVNIN